MILKVNLAACAVFIFATVGTLLFGSDLKTFVPGDLLIALIYLSPTLLWITGAWFARSKPLSSIVWFVVSFVFMSVELYFLILEAIATREEAITGQGTMHLAGFLVMILQWAVGLPLLAILGGFWLTGGSPSTEKPSSPR